MYACESFWYDELARWDFAMSQNNSHKTALNKLWKCVCGITDTYSLDAKIYIFSG